MEMFYQLSEAEKHLKLLLNGGVPQGHRHVVNSGCVFNRGVREIIYSYLNTNKIFKNIACLAREDRIIAGSIVQKAYKKSELKLKTPEG